MKTLILLACGIGFLVTGNLWTGVAAVLVYLIPDGPAAPKVAVPPVSGLEDGKTMEQQYEEHHQQWLRGGGNCSRHLRGGL